MTRTSKNLDSFEELRNKAQKLLQERGPDSSSYPTDVLELIEELKIHQAELEIQNEELKRSKQELRALQREYENLYDHAPCGYITLNSKGTISRCNQRGKELLGNVYANLYSLSLRRFVSQETQVAYLSALKEARESGQTQDVEFKLGLEEKNQFWVQASVQADLDEQGHCSQWRLTLTDISKRKKAEEELRQAKEQADYANRAKSEFLANMSHEIRTPIGGIQGMLQLLQMSDLDEDQQQYVDMAQNASQRLNRLLSDLLDLSKMEANKLEIREQEFKPREIMQSIEEIFTQTSINNNNSLQISLDDKIPERLIADSTRLNQILFNLVGNALKYTRQGRVDVQAFKLYDHGSSACRVLFIIEDNGIGISEDKLDLALENFTQVKEAESPYSREFEGAGLGLALVKRLVRLMQGSLCISSQEGMGTAVYLSLPFKLPQSEQAVSGSKKKEQAGEELSEYRILLADDDLMTQFHIQRLLEKSGCSVEVVGTGQEVLNLLASEKFDCVLMDVQMPEMDGVQATQEIRSSGSAFKDISIIALTAYAMNEDREKFLRAGMDDYLAKPVEQEQLVKTIKRNIPVQQNDQSS
jgi:PAS domain S-box-containing protein